MKKISKNIQGIFSIITFSFFLLGCCFLFSDTKKVTFYKNNQHIVTLIETETSSRKNFDECIGNKIYIKKQVIVKKKR
ncbi:hypothetical protein ACGWY0_002678 [Enterococcus hirae]